jgi:negative regulator of sigma-B (phosphoserine phosphatase)
MEIVMDSVLEYGVARFVLPGQAESGDLHVLRSTEAGTLIAVIDGIGHGEEAAFAAKAAADLLEEEPNEPVISLVQECHEKLKRTRGVVMSVASIDPKHRLLTWLGVGNVQGILVRSGNGRGAVQETLLLRAGVVGSQLPPLQASVLTVAWGDLLIFVTDGIRGDFAQGVSSLEVPQRLADRILDRYCRGTDDALVLVVKIVGIGK